MLEIGLWDGNLSKPLGTRKLPEPIRITPSEVGESTEGNLVQLKNVKVSSVEGYSLGSVPPWIAPGKKLDVVGVCMQYKDHYEVCPRSYEDLIQPVSLGFV